MKSDESDLDLCRELVSGLFKTEIAIQDDADILPYYHQLASCKKKYGERTIVGKGALKEVYRCRDIPAERDIAWATPREELGSAYYDQFIYEARLTASLRHPNIIKIHEVGIDADGRPYFTMDLKSGQQLSDAIRPLSISDRLNLFVTICGAIAYAHSQRILHLDLKPENIQCDRFGEVLVCDWGLGKTVDWGSSTPYTLPDEPLESYYKTLYGEIKGSPGYMAPEQVSAGVTKDYTTDIYALGGILYYLLTEECPVSIKNKDEVIPKTLAGAPSLSLHSNVPSALAKIVDKALSLEPEDRYQEVRLLQYDVQAYLEYRPIQQDSHNFFKVCSLFCLRHSRIFFASIGFVILLTSFSFWNQSREKRLRQINSDIAEAQISLSQDYTQLNAEYQYFENAMFQSKSELLDRIMGTSLKRFKQFHRIKPYDGESSPALLLHEADLLASKVYESGLETYSLPILIHSSAIQLNFKRILENEWEHDNEKYQKLISYARLFPDYNFGITNRPTIPQLVNFFELLATLDHVNQAFVHGVLHFDLQFREITPEYNLVVVAYLRALNQEQTHSISYSHEEQQLILDNIHSISHIQRYSGTSVLSHLRLKSLVLSGNSFLSSHLNQSYIQHVDLSQVDQITWRRPLNINDLQQLTIPHDSPASTFERLRSFVSDTIVIHPF